MRSLVICATLMLLARVFRWRIRPLNWRPVALRSLFFSSAMVLYFGAAGIMPIAQVGAGLFSAPIFVLVISALFLGTRIGIWRVLAVLIGFAGVLLILKPDAASLSILSALPLLAGLLYALNGIATRRRCAGESTVTLLMGLFAALGVWGALGLIWFAVFPSTPEFTAGFGFFAKGWVTPTPRFLVLLMVQAFGSLFAVAALTRGYQLAEVSFVAVFEYSFLVFAGFWGWILWRDIPDLQAVFGIVLITVAGVIITLRSR